MIKISVVIPAYNVERYISKTLTSIVNQTYKPYEIIVVNDGSTDKTVAVAEQTLQSSNIPYKIINQLNQGVSVARNRGLQEATGDYVHFLDSDDIILPKFYETLYIELEKKIFFQI